MVLKIAEPFLWNGGTVEAYVDEKGQTSVAIFNQGSGMLKMKRRNDK